MRSYFNDRDVELAANDVILAVEGRIGREDAKLIGRHVLSGFGVRYLPDRGPIKGRLALRFGNDD